MVCREVRDRLGAGDMMQYTVYAVLCVCSTLHIQYSGNAVIGVCGTRG